MLAEFWMAVDHDEQQGPRGNDHEPRNRDQGAIQMGNHPQQNNAMTMKVAGPIGLVILSTFVLVVILMHYLSPHQNPGNIFKIFHVVISAVMTCLCVVGLVGLWSCDINPVNINVGLDEVLLIASIFGPYSLCLCSIYAAVSVLSSDKDDYLNSYATLSLVSALTWIVQATLQANFISKALHREPKPVNRCFGIFNVTNIAVVLAFTNLGMWLFNTIDLEGHYQSVYSQLTLERLNKLQADFFGPSTWTWIMLVIYPLAIFFRIHSVSTLYRVWKIHKELPADRNQ